MKIEKYKVKSGERYRVRFLLPSGLRPSKSFRTKDLARVYLGKAQIDSNHVSRPKITFRDFCSLFINDYARNDLQPASIERYEGLIENYLVPHFGNALLESITSHCCQMFASKINGDVWLSQCQKSFVIGRFKSLLNRAVRYDFLNKSPALALSTPKRSLADIEYWAPEEVNRFLMNVKGSPRLPLYLIAFNTGMRVGEIFGLKWDAIDLNNGTVNVFRTWDQKTNAVKNSTKTHTKRSFVVNKTVLNFLKELKLRSNSEFVIDREKICCVCPSHASRYFREEARVAGIRDIRFHAIRHTFATIFVSNGGDIHKLAKILGHSSSTMTDRYAHFAPEVAHRVSEIVSFAPPSDTKVLPFGQGMVMEAGAISQSV